MNIKKYIPIGIAIMLFAVPFIWFKPGEMDLGGDSSRLYFYDPLSYLQNTVIFNTSPSGFGSENINYFFLPTALFLYFLKTVLHTPTNVISFFNGISLSIAFLSVYMIIKNLLKVKKSKLTENVIEHSAILGGFSYIFSPALISGWDKAIITHNQVFLNPLIFYLLLRFFTTKRLVFGLVAIIITFIFAPNFSYIASPPFFSFYPITILFLLVYTKYIIKNKIEVFKVLILIALFLLVQSFHLLPQISNLLIADSSTNTAVFSESAMVSRGLDYFIGIAPSIKASINFMNLIQMGENKSFSFLFIIFPAILVLGFYWNKEKMKLLNITAIFFLITFFFATANITFIGLEFYKKLFSIPGFAMFRNFYGQWGYVYLFYFTLLMAQSYAIILNKMKGHSSSLLTGSLILLLTLNAFDFINGSLVNKTIWQSKNIKNTIVLDNDYGKMIAYVKKLPIDGKVLTLPLTDPGYQLIMGTNNGAYQGPSTISYLAGKKDFAGYEELGVYKDTVLNAVINNDTKKFIAILSVLNVKYIFHNEDPRVYDDTFPTFPYDHVRNFLPTNQQEYKKFLASLPVKKIKQFGNKYVIYEIQQQHYIPHVYASTNFKFTNNTLALISSSLDTNKELPVAVPLEIYQAIKNNLEKSDEKTMIQASNNNSALELRDNSHLHIHIPFASKQPNSIFYPIIIKREKDLLTKATRSPQEYLDSSFLLLAKRSMELEFYGEKMPVKKHNATSSEWNLFSTTAYYSWERTMESYNAQGEELISWIKTQKSDNIMQNKYKIITSAQLLQHQRRIVDTIHKTKKTAKEKIMLMSITNKVFNNLLTELGSVPLISVKNQYTITVPEGLEGEYEIIMRNSGENISNTTIQLNDTTLLPTRFVRNSEMITFGKVNLPASSLIFYLNTPVNTSSRESNWSGIGNITPSPEMTILTTTYQVKEETEEFFKTIRNVGKNKMYEISFSYKTKGDGFVLRLMDTKILKKKNKSQRTETYLENYLQADDWRTYQTVFTTDFETQDIIMALSSLSHESNETIMLRDMKIIETPEESIFFQNDSQRIIRTNPEVVYKKINPTLYTVNVKGDGSPYILTLMDAYNNNWDLYSLTENDKKTFSPWVILGKIENAIINYFSKEKENKNTVISSKNNVKEQGHSTRFITNEIVDAWGNVSSERVKQFRTNDYANSWYVTPSRTTSSASYILELKSQRLFYIGLTISVISLCLCVALLIRDLTKNKKQ